jgi:hypothetical protein
VDDDVLYPVSALKEALRQVRQEHHEIEHERHPDRVEQALAKHSNTELVLVDMHFHQADTKLTGLTALRRLATYEFPAAAIYCQPEPNRRLFPFAACQLLDKPPIAWIEKTGSSVFNHAIPLISQIESRRVLRRSETLRKCYPDAQGTGNLMNKLLGQAGDLKIWRLLGRNRYKAEQVAQLVHFDKKTIENRYVRYVSAIIEFETAIGLPDIPDPSLPSRTVWRFAAQNSEFFHAPELDALVREKFRADNT